VKPVCMGDLELAGAFDDIVATATALAGAFWQMANPAPEVAALYRSDSRMADEVVEIEPRVRRILTAMLKERWVILRPFLSPFYRNAL
jgi:hypothetical protein